MRRYLLLSLLFLAALGVQAGQWGFLPDFVNENTGAGKETSAVPAEKKFLTHAIVNGNPVYYRIAELPDEKERPQRQDQISGLFKKWFEGTLKQIRARGREQEFADIIPILERGVDLRLAGTQQDADIVYHFIRLKDLQDICGSHAAGCLNSDEKPLQIYIPTDDMRFIVFSLGQQSTQSVGIHETGHALGLSDQYILARSDNSDAMYSAPTNAPAVMDRALDITCDDATGLINAIDLVRGTSRGRWQGLCETDYRDYEGGLAYNKTGFRFTLHDLGHIVMETYWDGKRTAAKEYSIDLKNNASEFVEYIPNKVLLADGQGRPLQAIASTGETIYFEYVFDKINTMVVADDKVKQFSQDFYNPKAVGGQSRRTRSVMFGKRGALCMLAGTVYANKATDLEMLWGVEKAPSGMSGYQASRRLVRAFDRKGKLELSLWQEKPQADFPMMTVSKEMTSGWPGSSPVIGKKPLTAEQEEINQLADAWMEKLK